MEGWREEQREGEGRGREGERSEKARADARALVFCVGRPGARIRADARVFGSRFGTLARAPEPTTRAFLARVALCDLRRPRNRYPSHWCSRPPRPPAPSLCRSAAPSPTEPLESDGPSFHWHIPALPPRTAPSPPARRQLLHRAMRTRTQTRAWGPGPPANHAAAGRTSQRRATHAADPATLLLRRTRSEGDREGRGGGMGPLEHAAKTAARGQL